MPPAEADKPLCFAIMPITTPDDAVDGYGGDKNHFGHVAKYIFEPAAVEAGYRFVPATVDRLIAPGSFKPRLSRTLPMQPSCCATLAFGTPTSSSS